MRIGFIGTGVIGEPMARRLVAKGFELIVCDRSDAALEPFRRTGVAVTNRASECARTDALIVMVATDDQVRATLLGPDGLTDGVDAAHPPVVAIMSSVLPDTVRGVAAALSAKKVACVDAPVSGGAALAGEGRLTIMAGGPDEDLRRLQPVFDALATRVFRCGPLGAGEAVKILNNILGVANTFLMTETARLAARIGVEPGWLSEVMEASSGRNFATRDFGAFQAILAANARTPDSARAVAAVCRKDLRLALSLANASGETPPLLEALARALDAQPDEAIYEAWRTLVP